MFAADLSVDPVPVPATITELIDPMLTVAEPFPFLSRVNIPVLLS